MFGHQDEPAQTNTFGDQPQPAAAAPAPSDDGTNGFSGGAAAPNAALPTDLSSFGAPPQATPPTDSNNLLESNADHGFTGAPPTSDAPETPAQDQPASDPVPDLPTSAPAHDQPTVGTPGPLGDLKQQALQQLAPLVSQLDQSPEEKFRTTMMMIQATDNQDLLPAAYEAANQISDEKAKAQALLDVVNEINYFSQK
jgi:hypothetical protein